MSDPKYRKCEYCKNCLVERDADLTNITCRWRYFVYTDGEPSSADNPKPNFQCSGSFFVLKSGLEKNLNVQSDD